MTEKDAIIAFNLQSDADSEPLDDTLDYLADIGVDAVEFGCGGFVGDDHLPRAEYLDDEDAQAELLDLVIASDGSSQFHRIEFGEKRLLRFGRCRAERSNLDGPV